MIELTSEIQAVLYVWFIAKNKMKVSMKLLGPTHLIVESNLKHYIHVKFCMLAYLSLTLNILKLFLNIHERTIYTNVGFCGLPQLKMYKMYCIVIVCMHNSLACLGKPDILHISMRFPYVPTFSSHCIYMCVCLLLPTEIWNIKCI